MGALTSLSEGASSKLAERWVAATTSAPFAFASAGLLVWLTSVGLGRGRDRLTGWVRDRKSAELLALAVVGLLVLSGAGVLIRQLATPALRLAEGYWPNGFRRLAERRRQRYIERRRCAMKELRQLAAVVAQGSASDAQKASHVRLDGERRGIPSDSAQVMPTRLGNRLRAAEGRPWSKYRLDAVKVWPALWLVLPDATRAELARARARVDGALVGCCWCLLAVSFAALAWWAAPVALVAMVVAYRLWVLPSVAVYADLVEASFDVHRFALYDALHLSPPPDASYEKKTGERLTNLLWRGSDDVLVRFDHTKPV